MKLRKQLERTNEENKVYNSTVQYSALRKWRQDKRRNNTRNKARRLDEIPDEIRRKAASRQSKDR